MTDANSAADAPPKLPAGRWVRFLGPLVVFLGVIVALHAYIGTRLITRPGWPLAVQALAWTLLFALFADIPLSFYLRRTGSGALSRFLQTTAYLWIGTFGILLSVVAAQTCCGSSSPASRARPGMPWGWRGCRRGSSSGSRCRS